MLAIFIKILVAIILAIFFFQLAIHGDFFPPPGDGHKKKVEALDAVIKINLQIDRRLR